MERFFVLGGTAFSLDSENEKDPSRLSEKVYLHPCLVSELHSSLQRSNQDSKALFVGENSISTPIVAVSVWLQCRRCGAHAYSVPDSTLNTASGITRNLIQKEVDVFQQSKAEQIQSLD